MIIDFYWFYRDLLTAFEKVDEANENGGELEDGDDMAPIPKNGELEEAGKLWFLNKLTHICCEFRRAILPSYAMLHFYAAK